MTEQEVILFIILLMGPLCLIALADWHFRTLPVVLTNKNKHPIRRFGMKKFAVLACVFIMATGCTEFGMGSAKENDGAADAPISHTDTSGWVIHSGVDRYSNIAFKCNGASGMYVPRNPDTMYSKFLVVVPNDPECAKK